MKYDEVTISRQLETTVPVENETQRILREALESFGPNGENWCRRALTNSLGQHCALGAINMVEFGRDISGGKSCGALALLAVVRESGERGGIAGFNNNAKDFSEVRAMFLKAIELAA